MATGHPDGASFGRNDSVNSYNDNAAVEVGRESYTSMLEEIDLTEIYFPASSFLQGIVASERYYDIAQSLTTNGITAQQYDTHLTNNQEYYPYDAWSVGQIPQRVSIYQVPSTHPPNASAISATRPLDCLGAVHFNESHLMGPATASTSRPVPPVPDRHHSFSELPLAQLVNSHGWGEFVEQAIYKPHTKRDRERYVHNALLADPIFFGRHDSVSYGVVLQDALDGNVEDLSGRDDRVLTRSGSTITMRLNWPGEESWSRSIPAKDYHNPRGPITLRKLSKEIAKTVHRFLDKRSRKELHELVQPWDVGRFGLEDLLLVSFHNVSKGSWQPHIRLRKPLSAF